MAELHFFPSEAHSFQHSCARLLACAFALAGKPHPGCKIIRRHTVSWTSLMITLITNSFHSPSLFRRSGALLLVCLLSAWPAQAQGSEQVKLAKGEKRQTMPRPDYAQVLLLGQPQEAFRSLGLIRQGYAPEFDEALPQQGVPALLQLLGNLEQASPSQPPQLEALWQLYNLPEHRLDPDIQRFRRRMLENIWSVRYLLTDPDTGAEIVRQAPQAYNLLLQYGEPLQLVGIEKRFYLPRIYFRTAIVPVASLADFTALLSKPGALRPFQQVAIAHPHHQPQGPELAPDVVSPQIVAAGPGTLEVKIEVPQAGYLVLADEIAAATWVRVDGQSAEIEIANGFQGAVWLEPGPHQVRFEGLSS